MRSIFALLLLVAVASAVAPIFQADSEYAIKGSYIVILNDGSNVADRDAHIAELKAYAVQNNDNTTTIGYVYDFPTIVGFSAELSDITLKHQVTHSNVKYIEANQHVYATAITQTGATWGINRISSKNLNLDGVYKYNNSAGAGVTVYVLDTGILTTHVEFAGRASSAFNAITGESASDLNGHGTHCAGTVGGTTYGVAKKATLKSVKVLSGSGGGTTAGVISGVNYVQNNAAKPAVGSMSLGGGASPTMTAAVQSAVAAGIPFAVAAGNSYANACNFSPANAPDAVCVGSTDRTDRMSSFSNYGTCVDIFAPGTSVTSAWIGSNTATSTISGTSMACPHVAGVIAMHLASFPTLTPAQVTTWLNTNSAQGYLTGLPASPASPNRLLHSPHH